MSRCGPSWRARCTPRTAPSACCPATSCASWWTTTASSAASTKAAVAKAKALYKTFCNGAILETDSKTAELSKLVENSFRDVNIAFANELSVICDRLGINVWETIALANRHPRVNILQPGPGVGGHCIAVDPWFIVSSAPEEARLIRTAREVNDDKPQWVIEKVRAKAERFKDAGDRLPGHHLQGQYRRHARVPLDGHRRSI